MSFVLQLLERIIIRQLMAYLSSADLHLLPMLQSCQSYYKPSIVVIWLLYSSLNLLQPSTSSITMLQHLLQRR